MSGSPSWPLQQAIYSRLSGDTTLVTTLGYSVYDHVPDSAPFPYVKIGAITEAPRDTMARTGRDCVVTVDCWSQYRGMKQVDEGANRVDALLDRWDPTVTGWTATTMLREFFEAFDDPDGKTRHGVLKYRVHLNVAV